MSLTTMRLVTNGGRTTFAAADKFYRLDQVAAADPVEGRSDLDGSRAQSRLFDLLDPNVFLAVEHRFHGSLLSMVLHRDLAEVGPLADEP